MEFGKEMFVPRFPIGKIPHEYLLQVVFNRLGTPDERVLLGPAIGEDAAVLDFGDRVLILASDPITAAIRRIGWLSVHINANDIASCGARPRWFLCSILLPEGSSEEEIKEIFEQIDEASKKLGIALIGGHTEITAGINRPIIVGFMAGEAEKGRYVTTGGARPGGVVILTKGAGIEGTAVLASELAGPLGEKLGREVVDRAARFMEEISVVEDAEILMNSAEVEALHDPTEGGVACGLWELAQASAVSLIIREEAIPVREETRLIADALGLNPLNILGSGSLLAVVSRDSSEEAVASLRGRGIDASIIGEVGEGKGVWLVSRDGKVEVKPPERDEVYEVLEEVLGRSG